jgi:beta-galactosidase
MLLATQYYRPPFPERPYWREDLARMRDAGMSGVQLWVVWAWVEAQPGSWDFRDYDEIVSEAARVGLRIVLSAKAELQPLWIPRLIPDSYMVDHMGRRVISSNRCESNFGFTPGGCTDNPAVRARMAAFLQATAARYAQNGAIYGWDCWNELRWNVQADGYVCYCPHTLHAFRAWLDRQHGGLDGLNRDWKRRYVSWEDVYPGKLPDRPYTEMVEFCRFLAWRAADHARFRYQCLRSADPHHVITAHSAAPYWMQAGGPNEQVMARGNDFDTADQLDGFGCSHFPFWGGKTEDASFAVRVQSTRSAARGKVMWVSELQGGSACDGFLVNPPVDAKSQQRWVWNGIAHGAKATIFWCWRDEVFGRESSGFGIVGNDGCAEERIAAMKDTGQALSRHDALLEAYQPDPGRIGLYIEPTTLMVEFARYGHAGMARASLMAYATALARMNLPFEIVDPGHLDVLSHLKLLILPFPLVVRQDAAQRIMRFVDEGGTVLTEGELDAFTPMAFYRYPGADRSFAARLGLCELGRRPMEAATMAVASLGEGTFQLRPSGWLTPYEPRSATPLAANAAGQPIALLSLVGGGRAIAVGSFLGKPYMEERYDDFERFLRTVAESSGVLPALKVEGSELVHWKTGLSGWPDAAHPRRLVFLLNPGPAQTVSVASGTVLLDGIPEATELLTGATLQKQDARFIVRLPEKGVSVLMV